MWEVIIILWLCYLVLFWISLKIKDNSIVDVFWWTWFVLLAWILFFQSDINNIYSYIFLWVLSLWWLRITYYIWKRKLKFHEEDPRYAKWRNIWKSFKIRSFFQVYLLQWILLLTISIPIILIFSNEIIGNTLFYIWIILMLIWISYESIADYQVKKYLEWPHEKNMIFTWGLYRFSRHPNYLGESIFWLWVSIISLQISILWMLWFIVITFLLLFVSWVPMKEQSYKNKKNWKEYSKNTPKFIPNYFLK